jgi:hypothetical protein
MSDTYQHLGERRFYEPPVIADVQLVGPLSSLRKVLWMSAGLVVLAAGLLLILA